MSFKSVIPNTTECSSIYLPDGDKNVRIFELARQRPKLYCFLAVKL